ncbi:MAG: tRNA lysidine(34) synthetase TilS [Rhodobiaceae bacterium]|nr:tRNA lysidine(34) synthetase TilS [Rhodobiaceae bacterium]
MTTARSLTAPEFDRLLRPLSLGPRLAVGVSGGADSVALMVLLVQWRDWRMAKGREVPSITVLSVDHGLRAEAADEVRAVKRWAVALSLPHKAFVWEGEKSRANLQAEARRARYELLTEWCRKGAEPADLLTAHHLDDQAETFLLRLQRGSGVDGLSAMAPVSERSGVRLLRPLLDVPRDRLRATLDKAGQAWIEDPSNQDERFLRVQVRNALPVLEGLGLGRDRLITTARAMTRARTALEGMVDVLERDAVVWSDFGFAQAGLSAFRDAPDEIALRLLARLLKKAGGSEYAPRLAGLEGLLEVIRAGELGRGRTLGGVKLTGRAAQFFALREPAAVSDTVMPLRSGKTLLWDGRFEVRLKGRLGAGQVRALGKSGVQFLKKEGVAAPAEVPKLALETLPGLWDGNQLLAQPHLGFLAEGAPGFGAEFCGQNAV